MKRREFLRTGVVAGAALQFPHLWIKNSLANPRRIRISLLQTNDTHSRIDPFPMDGSRNQGLGGIARRATLVERIRRQNPFTLLVDAGDTFQGTPYFNLFKGRVEYVTMSACGYDAATPGNHEFDNGVVALSDVLQYAKFEMVNCNFDFGDSPIAPLMKTFITRKFSGLTVGITGVGIDFTDLVAAKNHQGVEYSEPYEPLQSVVNYLRKDLRCSLIVVLSHLGYKYSDERADDVKLAHQVDGIDWIVGGHTHTFMDEPEVIISDGGYTTRVLQVGWAGILLGKTDFVFEYENLVAVENQIFTVDADLPEAREIQRRWG